MKDRVHDQEMSYALIQPCFSLSLEFIGCYVCWRVEHFVNLHTTIDETLELVLNTEREFLGVTFINRQLAEQRERRPHKHFKSISHMANSMTLYEERKKWISDHESSFSEKGLAWVKLLQQDAPYWSVRESTSTWLGHWLSAGADIVDLPQTVIEDLQHYRLTCPTLLYRGEVTHAEPSERQTYTTCSSWTYNLAVARSFAELGDNDNKSVAAVVSTIALPHESLVDTTRIPYKFDSNREEKEVILLPGIYSLEMIEPAHVRV